MFGKVSIRKVREFWDRRPCNIRHATVDINENPSLFSQQVTTRKYFVEPHIPGFAQFDRWSGKTVLEIGCGIGTDTLSFAKAGAFVTAVDISNKSLEIARRRADVGYLTDRIAFFQANTEYLSDHIPIHPYDLIYSFGVLHHTPNPAKAVMELQRFMNENSTLKLMLYHRNSWRVAQILLKSHGGSISERIAAHSEAQTGCPVTWTFSKHGARILLKDFDIFDMRIDHIFPYRIPDYIEHRHIKEWYWQLMPDCLFRSLKRWFGWHLLITARKGRKAC